MLRFVIYVVVSIRRHDSGLLVLIFYLFCWIKRFAHKDQLPTKDLSAYILIARRSQRRIYSDIHDVRTLQNETEYYYQLGNNCHSLFKFNSSSTVHWQTMTSFLIKYSQNTLFRPLVEYYILQILAKRQRSIRNWQVSDNYFQVGNNPHTYPRNLYPYCGHQ